MAAEAAIAYVVRKLGHLLIQKAVFLRGVEGQVEWLIDELQRMQYFLKDASRKQANNESIRYWISEIRKAAQDAEDAMETFILKVDNPSRSRGRVRRWASFPNHMYHLYKVGKQIESIQTKLHHIEKGRQMYGIQNIGDEALNSPHIQLSSFVPTDHSSEVVVGLDRDLQLLCDRVISCSYGGLSTFSIVGIGGTGKSTLAKLVYQNVEVVKHFDVCAWVCVSCDFRPEEIITQVLLQLPYENVMMSPTNYIPLSNLKFMLHQHLKGKQYLIVLDDVWERADLESLRNAFPDQVRGSVLLVTSRNRNIPNDAQHVHEMKFLNPSESWELLLRKALPDNIDGECPEDLQNIGREIVKKCDGLPLAITAVGKLLREQSQSKSAWETVLKEMNAHFGKGRNVWANLEMSYQNLCPQLKSCFLCLSFFKEGASIRAEKLLQIWIAEGLVEQIGEVTIEEIARNYLDELINRNMVQVKEMGSDGQVKMCYIHNLLRELAITKAEEDLSFKVLREEEDDDESSQSSYRARHLATYCSGERFIDSINQNKHLRSLFFHGAGNIDGSTSYWKSFKLLRVLDFEDFGLANLPDTIGKLIALRYLGLRNNNVKELPNSLGRLENLQVLDIARNKDVKVPNIIWKLVSLRHIYMSEVTWDRPLKIGTLKHLQSLTYIPAGNWMLEPSEKIISVQELAKELKNYDWESANAQRWRVVSHF